MARFAPALLAVFAVAVIAAALLFTGGPEQARIDARDGERLRDLTRLSESLTCDDRDITLPETLAALPERFCGNYIPERVTTFDDGDYYAFERLSDTQYRICAGFEDMERLEAYSDIPRRFDPDTGCITGDLRR